MSSTGFLTWALLTISLVNAILLLWLGLTVLLNADRRRWGIWLVGAALLTGGLFFLAHAGLVGHGKAHTVALLARWPLAWLPGIVQPLAWYVVMLWHAGFWENRQAVRRHGLHRAFLTGLLTFVALGVLMCVFFWISIFHPYDPRVLFAGPYVGRIPVLAIIYLSFIILCVILSLDVLRHPAPSSRVMGDLARRRARPWLFATSVVLVVVSMLVGGAGIFFWLSVAPLYGRMTHGDFRALAVGIAWFDLLLSSLIALSVLLLGQAIVAYEIFTGKTLPRRGLRRNWRRIIILALGFSGIMSLGVVLRLPTVYGLPLISGLLVLFFALYNWRSYAERERHMHYLRPFVTGLRMYDALLDGATPDVDVSAPFCSLCENVLGVRLAFLAAQGPFASLIGPPIAYPADLYPPTSLIDIINKCDSPRTMCLPLDPSRYTGAEWAVPLWSERGLTGLLLLGEKADGGLFTQEEIEIARAAGERLIDTLASTRIAQRLMVVQRERLVESRLLDRRTRRVLHDDVLPQVHAALLTLNTGGEAAKLTEQLTDIHRALSRLLHQMPTGADAEILRLGLVEALRRVVQEESGGVFDEVTWEIGEGVEEQLEAVPVLVAEVLFCAAREAIRNAAKYGQGGNDYRPLRLTIRVAWENGPRLVIEDDGVGIQHPQREHGTGQGMILHSTMMAVIGGAWVTESQPSRFTRVTLSLPEKSDLTGQSHRG